MKLETKYNIGDRVWVVYEYNVEVCIHDDVICDICVNKDGVYYILDESCEDKIESEIILYEDKIRLLAEIEKIIADIHKKEKKC